MINRNPFLLAQLNPAAVIRSTTEQSPYHHWAATQVDVGGNTSTKNDVVVDGAPNMASEKSAYTPAMDAVQEVNIQQNAVDAEFGHSAGGVITVQMKSGTNAYHGTGYYLGRNPAINAVADHITRRANLTRNHILGGTLGSPVVKNKVFNFVSYELWRSQDPRSVAFTLPTDAERAGDFSKSINARGGLRTIYNPFTTVLNADGSATRQPYPGNHPGEPAGPCRPARDERHVEAESAGRRLRARQAPAAAAGRVRERDGDELAALRRDVLRRTCRQPAHRRCGGRCGRSKDEGGCQSRDCETCRHVRTP